MTAQERIVKFAKKAGVKLKKQAEKESPANISSAAKQKALLIKIATDLGYLE